MEADHPFLAEPRIVLSPHIGGVTADAYVKMAGRGLPHWTCCGVLISPR